MLRLLAVILVLVGCVTPVYAEPHKHDPRPTPVPKPPATQAPSKPAPTLMPRLPAPPTAAPAPPAPALPAPAEEQAASPPAEAGPPPAAPAPPPPAPAPARAAEPLATATAEPTTWPTYETVIISVTNAPADRTPLPTSTARPTAAIPTPEVAGVQTDSSPSVVDEILTSTFEPVLAGGKIGLVTGAAGMVGWAALKLLRGRKANR